MRRATTRQRHEHQLRAPQMVSSEKREIKSRNGHAKLYRRLSNEESKKSLHSVYFESFGIPLCRAHLWM